MTPPALAEALFAQLCEVTFPHLAGSIQWCEPSVGDGAFARAMTHVCNWGWTVDADAARKPQLISTFQDFAQTTQFRFDVVMGNPPYSQWEEFVPAAMRVLLPGGYAAFLLRLSVLGGLDRAQGFWTRHPLAHLIPIAPRPSFGLNKHGKKGTDGTEYGLFVWRKGSRAAAKLHPPLVWKPTRTREEAVAPAPEKQEGVA